MVNRAALATTARLSWPPSSPAMVGRAMPMMAFVSKATKSATSTRHHLGDLASGQPLRRGLGPLLVVRKYLSWLACHGQPVRRRSAAGRTWASNQWLTEPKIASWSKARRSTLSECSSMTGIPAASRAWVVKLLNRCRAALEPAPVQSPPTLS